MASSLADGIWNFGSDRSRIFGNIHDGIPDRGMPGYGQVLGADDVNALVDYMNSVSQPTVTNRMPPETMSTLDYAVRIEVFASGLEIPWAIDFIDTNTALITERPGRLRVVEQRRMRPEPVQGTPTVLHSGQGGLMDVALDPEYASNGWIYLGYSHELTENAEPGRGPAMTRIVRGKLQGNRWVDQQVIYEAPHDTYRTTRQHYGTRIVFDRAGHLYFSIGDRGSQNQAQELSRPNGKIHRINRDGTIPADNPFRNREGALPSIFSYGHRNPQGLAIHPETGDLWCVEHGPRGGDELNLVVKGANYGWPVVTYGINYSGTIITEEVARPDMVSPILYWRPSLGVGGLEFYTGNLFPKWRGKALATALNFQEVQVLNVLENRVLHSEVVMKGMGRIREIVTGPDGALYGVLNRPDIVVRLTPLRAQSR
jgi:glucose/arabinose dehydrogenase